MRFSERNGYITIKYAIQREFIDDELKKRLWSLLDIHLYSNYRKPHILNREIHSFLDQLIQNYWYKFFKESTDEIPIDNLNKINTLKDIFQKQLSWFRIYDFIEFTLIEISKNLPESNIFHQIKEELNTVLEDEKSAYRLIDLEVVEITSEQEIQSIEEAIENTTQYFGIQEHLNQALKLMSDRQKPDYRNSIKESISAVESICKIVTNDNKATLGQALKIIEDKFGLHPALKSSLSQLYGYTSDADGIRHAILEESNLTYIDAKFMLVACTNFINYLIDKTK